MAIYRYIYIYIYIYVYPLLIDSFHLLSLYVYWFVWLYYHVCLFQCVSSLACFLVCFLPKLGCINVLRVYLRIVHSLNINVISIHFTQFGMLTMITQRQIHGWQGEDVDKRQIPKYSTMFKGYELSARKTENKPLSALMSFRGSFNLYFNYYYNYDYYFDYYLIIFSLGGFSETGCHVVTSKSNSEETVCSCNHLTNFAVLLDYNGIPGVMNWFSPYL